jgi:hypothetical protein
MPFGICSKAFGKVTANHRSLIVVERLTCMSDNNPTLASAEPLNDAANWRANLTRNGFKISFLPGSSILKNSKLVSSKLENSSLLFSLHFAKNYSTKWGRQQNFETNGLQISFNGKGRVRKADSESLQKATICHF